MPSPKTSLCQVLLVLTGCVTFTLSSSECHDFSCPANNTVCLNGQCLCDRGYFENYENNGECEERVMAGGSCNGTNPYVCKDYPHRAHCNQSGRCECRPANKYFHNTKTNVCLERVSAGATCNGSIGDECVEHAQCNGTCTCEDSHYEDQGNCTARKGVGHPCDKEIQHSKQCVDNAFCDERLENCTCVDGFFNDEKGNCTESLRLGDMCDSNITDENQCKDKNAGCYSQVCECNKGFYNKKNETCEKSILVGLHCDASIKDWKQCIPGAHCSLFNSTVFHISTSTCICNGTHFHSSLGKCEEITTTSPISTISGQTTSPVMPLDEYLLSLLEG